jgi:hypothetical protein
VAVVCSSPVNCWVALAFSVASPPWSTTRLAKSGRCSGLLLPPVPAALPSSSPDPKNQLGDFFERSNEEAGSGHLFCHFLIVDQSICKRFLPHFFMSRYFSCSLVERARTITLADGKMYVQRSFLFFVPFFDFHQWGHHFCHYFQSGLHIPNFGFYDH